MPLPRAGCAVAAVGDAIIVAGGTYWRDGQKFWCDRADRLDPTTGHWTPLPPLPRLGGDAAGVACSGSFVVVGGGGAGVGERSVLSLGGDGRWESWQALPAGRRSLGAAVHEGEIFVFGGLAGGPADFGAVATDVWSCRPRGQWVARQPLPGPSRFNTAAGSAGGRIILAGGCTPDGGSVRNLDEVLAYDPRADAWSVIGRLPEPSRGGFGVSNGDSLYILGGYTDRFRTTILRVDGMTGKVEQVGDLPVGLADARFVRCQNMIIGVSGEDGIKHRYPDVIRATIPRT